MLPGQYPKLGFLIELSQPPALTLAGCRTMNVTANIAERANVFIMATP